MKRRLTRWIPLSLSVSLISLTWVGGATAQFVPAGAGVPSTAGANPMGASFASPFLLPYATALSQQPMDPSTFAMAYMVANQANRGLGSGIPSGTRPGTAVSRKAQADKESTRAPGSNVPGAMASRFFNRTTPVYLGTKRYYNRQGSYYPPVSQVR